eukprot:Gregarina_sp_Poly_1__404@NODE_10_length_23460_cov_121_463087_g8_i1_p5_GENE_NODE_10_length_23460_cov_121_463087_g8_i1NODE_10_length_23460_cov_121_463087_g8_i1_p5_ORF_typecomplete_len400_score65_99RrnaAD/PF00398_20/3e69PCMT/PF01135_19/7_3e13Methyltransf_31/PF13847_6/3_8e10Methyltransf_31/PF13847_6/4_8e03MTS/PF05175_14/2_3e09Ubie_methyltran/PF01209_18/1_4e08Methyltransf_25/PF13649_6/3_1e08DOT1/PF08123_13/6_9e07N6_Mtase/PF02384_16/1_5e06PrmA/PF06325_13/3_7e06NodS/PF05401_11/9_3e06NodS/PF05401_11/2_4
MVKLFAKTAGVSFPGAGQLKETAAAWSKPKQSGKAAKQAKADGPNRSIRLGKLSFKMNKQLGQHLLKNPGVVAKIVQAADIKRSDVVLEIGPGTGNLTIQLCSLARKVVAIEIDSRMAAEVKKRCLSQGYNNIEIKEGDALKTDYGQFHICLANLPYQISSPFLFKLISHPQHWRCAVLMFQKEFGERILAQPGEAMYCRLGVNTQVFCSVTRVCNVAAASFNPPPKVDSIAVKIIPKQRVEIVGSNDILQLCGLQLDYAQWDGMLRILFSRKRRTLAASLKSSKTARRLMTLSEARALMTGAAGDITGPISERCTHFKQQIDTILRQLVTPGYETGWAQRRTIELSIEELLVLQKQLHEAGIFFVEANNVNAGEQMFEPAEQPGEESDIEEEGDIDDV